MGCELEVADRRMTTTVKLVFPPSLVSSSSAVVHQLMGDGMFHRRAFAQGGPAAFGFHLGPQLLLELLVLADGQAPALPEPGFATLPTHRTRVTRAGRKLGVPPWDHRHGLAVGTSARAVLEVQRAGGLAEPRPAWRPGAGHAGDTRRRPLGQPWAGPGPQVQRQLPQALATLQCGGHPLHGLLFRLVGWADDHRAGHCAVASQAPVLLETVEPCRTARAAVAPLLV